MGGYDLLNGGNILVGFQALTGDPVFHLGREGNVFQRCTNSDVSLSCSRALSISLFLSVCVDLSLGVGVSAGVGVGVGVGVST